MLKITFIKNILTDILVYDQCELVKSASEDRLSAC